MGKLCHRCQRKGYALFPVLYAVAPKALQAQLPKLAEPFGAGITQQVLKQHDYYLRGLEAGYVYLLYPNKQWKGYLVDPEGAMLYYPNLTLEDMPAAPPDKPLRQTCSNQAHNSLPGRALCIEDTRGPVWIAFSRHRWTKAVRDGHAKHPAMRMQAITALDDSPFAHALPASPANLKQWVANFDEMRVRQLNRSPLTAGVLNDNGHLTRLPDQMKQMSATGKQGLIMALFDPVGITATLNASRNGLAEQILLQDDKLTQPEREDLMVASLIMEMKQHIEAQASKGETDPEDRAEAQAKGWQRYEKHLDHRKYDPVLKKLQAKQQLAKQLETYSTDYVGWMKSTQLGHVLNQDIDPADPGNGLALEHYFVICASGSGHTKEEHEQLWQPWLTSDDVENNLLWRAATANDKATLAFLLVDKIDKTFDLNKGGKDVFKEAGWVSHLLEVLHRRPQEQQYRRAYNQATEHIANMIASKLAWLSSQPRHGDARMRRTAARMATILASRADVVMVPQTFKARAHHYVRWAQEAYLGKPHVRAPIVTGGPARSGQVKLNPDKFKSPAARRVVVGMDGPLMLDLSTPDHVIEFSAWVAQKSRPGQPPDQELAGLLRRLEMQATDLTLAAPTFNPLSDQAKTVRVAKLDRAFSAGTGFFVLYGFINTWTGLKRELNKGQAADPLAVQSGYAGLGTAMLSSIAVGMEIHLANLTIRNPGINTLRMRVMGGVGGGITIACGAVDAYFLWRQAEKLDREGDKDAGKLTLSAARYTLASAGVLGGTAIAVAFFSFAGIGVAIAITVGLAFAVAALIKSFQAAEATDTDLEKWLDRSRFGLRLRPDSRTSFLNLQEEVTVFRQAIYAVAIQCTPTTTAATLTLDYIITVPLFTRHSAMRVVVSGSDLQGLPHVLKSSLFRIDGTEQIETLDQPAVARHQASGQIKQGQLTIQGNVMVRLPPESAFRDPQRPGRILIRVGSQAQDVSHIPYFERINVSITYQPDKQSWPELTIESQA